VDAYTLLLVSSPICITALKRCLNMLGTTITVRMKQKDRKLLEKVCDARGEDLSHFIRRAIRKELASLSFYPEETEKALGLEITEA
jgi:hypothetical protein